MCNRIPNIISFRNGDNSHIKKTIHIWIVKHLV